MVTGLEVAVGFLIARSARKAGKAWKRIDGMADEALDVGLDKLHDRVAAKLAGDPALRQLEAEATSTGEAGTRTQARVRLALEEAAEQDPTFAADLEAALTKLQVSAGGHGVTIGRDIRADSGVSIVLTGGSITRDRRDPFRAARAVSPHIAGLTTFVGREDELRDLRAAFQSHKVQVLAGMGGVGKTGLARAYAQRHLGDYGVVWWVRAEDPAAIDAEFLALLEILLPPGEAALVGNARTAAFALLAKQKHPWLLVLDNVPDATSAQGLLPPAGNGHVLITSRATAWPNPITVRPLDADAAVELLTTQSGDSDHTAAKILAAELGGLPLALTQVAGFVRANAIDLATYLSLYRDRGAELHGEGRPADYPHTVATTWQLAMDRLSVSAREMLNVLAFFAPDAIPVHMLFGEMDELARLRAIGELRAYSLVTPAEVNTVTVHRLVQVVTRDELGPHLDEWADKARKLLMIALTEQPVTATSLATWKTLHTHALAILDYLPPEHSDTLTIRHELTRWIREARDATGARDSLAELLSTREWVLRAEHSEARTIRSGLAPWFERTAAASANKALLDLLHDDEVLADSSTLPVTIYLSDVSNHERVEEAVAELLASAGGYIDHRDDPVIGSWYRRMRAKIGGIAHSPAARDAAMVAAHAAESRLFLGHDASVTATMMQNLGPVITALHPTRDAVVRVGALLIVKVNWVVGVHQLTAAQQLKLNHEPRLAASPHEILAALQLDNASPASLNGEAPHSFPIQESLPGEGPSWLTRETEEEGPGGGGEG